MANLRYFHGKKKQHCEIANAVNREEEEDKPETGDIAMIGPSLSLQENNLENEDDGSQRFSALRFHAN